MKHPDLLIAGAAVIKSAAAQKAPLHSWRKVRNALNKSFNPAPGRGWVLPKIVDARFDTCWDAINWKRVRDPGLKPPNSHVSIASASRQFRGSGNLGEFLGGLQTFAASYADVP